MIKKIVISGLISVTLLTQVVNAQTKVGNAGVITGTVGVASQYISKGLDANRDKPTASLTGEFASSTDIQLILGAGIFYSRPDFPVTAGAGFDYELDYNIGIRKSFDSLTLDLGYSHYTYPQVPDRFSADSGQFYAKAVLAATKNTSLSIYYEQDDTNGLKPGSTNTPTGTTAQRYMEFSLSHNFGPATANASYGNWKDHTSFYKLGLAKEFVGINFSADYIDQDRDSATWNANARNGEKFFVLGASKSF